MARRQYPKHPMVGVAGVVIDGDRVLLVRRAREPLKGEWSLPGGVVELGERLTAALRREIFEETGVRVGVEAIVKVLDRITKDAAQRVKFHYVLIDFLCSAEIPTDHARRRAKLRASDDASEARWVRRRDLPKYSLAPATLRVIEKAFEAGARLRPRIS